MGVFSDGTLIRDAAQLSGITFHTTSTAIVTISSAGLVRAIGPGVAQLTAALAGFEASINVAVDPRGSPSISAIAVVPQPFSVSLDNAPLFAVAAITGHGALDGIPVEITLTSGGLSSTQSAVTDIAGSVMFRLDGALPPGTVVASASVSDPATGSVRGDSETFTISGRSSDSEPNDSPASASPLTSGQTFEGKLNSATDSRDTYAFEGLFEGIDIGSRDPERCLARECRPHPSRCEPT